MGEDTSYDIKNQALIDRLEGVPDEKRTARLYVRQRRRLPDGSTEVVRGTMEGRIGYEITGENGFGYDPIFYLPQFGCSSAELEPEKKNELSHRGEGLRKMRKVLEKRLESKQKDMTRRKKRQLEEYSKTKDRKIKRNMKIVIVSDTHGSRKNIENVCECNPDADMLIPSW